MPCDGINVTTETRLHIDYQVSNTLLYIWFVTAGSETKRLDLGRNVATHRRDSFHAPGHAVREGGQAEVGEGDQGKTRTGQEEEDGGGGGGGGGYDEGGSTPHPRDVAPPSGVVQGNSWGSPEQHRPLHGPKCA